MVGTADGVADDIGVTDEVSAVTTVHRRRKRAAKKPPVMESNIESAAERITTISQSDN